MDEKKAMVKNILISGGWGYGNIGDDAILISTINLVKNFYPMVMIKVMSYDPINTRSIAGLENIEVVESIHRFLVGDLAYRRFKVVSEKDVKTVNVLARKFKSLLFKGEKKLKEELAYIKSRNIENFSSFERHFKEADLFIQSGGGYFTGGWVDSVYSHVLELKISKKVQTTSIIMGQSLGPFLTSKIKKCAISGFIAADYISVRDEESLNDLASFGIKSIIIPDIVLSETTLKFEHQPSIAMVVGSGGIEGKVLLELTESLKELSLKLNYKIKIIVTRLWKYDLEMAKSLFISLNHHKLDVVLVVPSGVDDLQKTLGECSLIISQNLHGLILAWRAGLPGVCLNEKRKFKAFMAQSDQMDRILNIEKLNRKELNKLSIEANKEVGKFIEKRVRLAEAVKNSFHEFLKDATIKSGFTVK